MKMNLTAWARERQLRQYTLLETHDLLQVAELPAVEHFRGLLQWPATYFSPRVMLYVARKRNALMTILVPSAQMRPLASSMVTHSEWTFAYCSHAEELGHIVLFYEGKYYLHYNQVPETPVDDAPPVAGTLHLQPYLAIREEQLSPIQPRCLENSCQDLIPDELLLPILDLFEKCHGSLRPPPVLTKKLVVDMGKPTQRSVALPVAAPAVAALTREEAPRAQPPPGEEMVSL